MENPSATNLTLTSNYNAALVLATLRDIRMIASSGEGRKKKSTVSTKCSVNSVRVNPVGETE